MYGSKLYFVLKGISCGRDLGKSRKTARILRLFLRRYEEHPLAPLRTFLLPEVTARLVQKALPA